MAFKSGGGYGRQRGNAGGGGLGGINKGSATLTHANTADVDKTFTYSILG
jgi:hypothetical protein